MKFINYLIAGAFTLAFCVATQQGDMSFWQCVLTVAVWPLALGAKLGQIAIALTQGG